MEAPPKAAWYLDPGAPGRDRWWSGTAWTKYTARTPTGSMAWFGLDYPRAMRAGANRVLITARILNIVGAVGFFVLLVAVPGIVASSPPPGVRWAFLIVLILIATSPLAAAVLGAIGLSRARRLGGFGLSIWALVVGPLIFLFYLVPLLIVVFAGRPQG
jgi:hypothetical protein